MGHASVCRLIQTHLDALRQSAPEAIPGHPDIHWLRGDWNLLHQNRWGIDPCEPFGPRWESAEKVLSSIVRELRAKVDLLPSIRPFFRPPLWPINGNGRICGEALVARPEVMTAELNIPHGGRDWNVAWGLLCQAEERVWQALFWEVAVGAGIAPEPNPFRLLLEIYALGAFPMGWDGDGYAVYARP